jgi:hypothetical protein
LSSHSTSLGQQGNPRSISHKTRDPVVASFTSQQDHVLAKQFLPWRWQLREAAAWTTAIRIRRSLLSESATAGRRRIWTTTTTTTTATFEPAVYGISWPTASSGTICATYGDGWWIWTTGTTAAAVVSAVYGIPGSATTKQHYADWLWRTASSSTATNATFAALFPILATYRTSSCAAAAVFATTTSTSIEAADDERADGCFLQRRECEPSSYTNGPCG